jgi:hypothetical protein
VKLFKTASPCEVQVTEEQLSEGWTVVRRECDSAGQTWTSKLDAVDTINIDREPVLLEAVFPVLLAAESELDQIPVIQHVEDQNRPF